MSIYIQILRWIAVLPVAVIAAIVALFPLRFFLYLIFTKFFEVYPEMPERILSPVIISGVFIIVGAKISPAFKFETAVALFGILMVLVGGTLFVTLNSSENQVRQLYFQYYGIGTLMAVIGAIIGLAFVWAEEKNLKEDT